MLSRTDIMKKIKKKQICIYPINENNFKENSVNLSASRCAWSRTSGKVFVTEEGEILNIEEATNKSGEILQINEGSSSVFNIKDKDSIILLPLSTTLIQTEEVISVERNIGGTYHSKVGIASEGIGHIGTMLGPNFSGHSLVPIHNITSKPLKIDVGDTFVSVVFNQLRSPLITNENGNKNGHREKLSKYKINISDEDEKFLDGDWKMSLFELNRYLNTNEEYKKQKKKLMKRYYTGLDKAPNFIKFTLSKVKYLLPK